MSRPIIVVADDDRSLLFALKARLESAGFEVHAAQDGFMTVQAVRRLSPDAVLLDVGMPAGDGFSVEERVRHSLGDELVEFVFMTGSQETEVLEEARARHAFAMIRKPFDGDEVVRVLRGAVESRRAREAAVTGQSRHDAEVESG
jgi:two-component system OmpR family response regulator